MQDLLERLAERGQCNEQASMEEEVKQLNRRPRMTGQDCDEEE